MNDPVLQSRLDEIKREFRQGFIEFCGLEAVEIRPGILVSRVHLNPEHRQQDGFVHAGLMATMADHTAGYAAYTLVPDDHRILTVEFKINLLRPAMGRSLICRSRVIKPGRRILICESEVFDQRSSGEVLAAKAQLTMASVPASELTPR